MAELAIPFLHISFSPLELVLFTLLAALLIAIFQASAAVIRYRSGFGDAPLPIVPSHGVVLARNLRGTSVDDDVGAGGHPGMNGKQQEIHQHDHHSSSLRLLLVGDSLAVGVGQSVRCTPVMPEVIARELSKATGKAVFWTCHGESGASAGWIIRELERGGMVDHESDRDVQYDACADDSVEVEGTLTSRDEIMIWKERLNDYRQSFDPNGLGPYDVVVVLTGTNDLKIMLFPFLIIDEDKELRKRLPKGGFIEDLQALIQTINVRMKRSVLNLSERAERLSRRIRGNTEEFESLLTAVSVSTRGTVPEESETTFEDEASDSSDEEEVELNNGTNGLSADTPLFVLPAMPIRISPSIQTVPLRWLTIPVFDRMEAKKRKLAKANPGEILWVKDPDLKDVIAYEEQRGPLWEQRNEEETLLSLRYIRGGASIKEAMTRYYQRKSDSFDTVNDPTPLFERPGRPGTKVFCADRIHPNEAGYELWAQHIANAIIADLKRRKKHK